MMSEQPATRAIAYCRQSEGRSGETATDSLSIRSQELRFHQWCASNNAIPVAVVSDHDVRGTVADRPGLADLRRAVIEHRPTVLWVISLSRLARDIVIHFSIIRDLQTLGVTRIVSETEGEVTDEFFHGIMALMHSKARKEMSAHLKGAFARRARDGGFPTGPTPLGFARPHRITITRANGTRYERATGEPVIDEPSAELVRDLFHRAAAGESLTAITASLRNAGPGTRGGQWRATTLRRLLTSPIYAGDIAHHGDVVAHDERWAIIDRATWNAVQQRIASNVVVRNTDREHHALEGLVRHDCGQRMYFQPDKRGGSSFICRGQWEGSCTGERRIIGARLLMAAVRTALTADLGNRAMPATALRMAQDASGGPLAVKRHRALDKRATDAQNRWQRAYERFVAGKIDSALMDTEDATLAATMASVDQDRATIPAPPDPDAIERTAAMLTTVAESMGAASDDRLAQLVRTLGGIVVSAAGVRIDYLPAFAPHLTPSTVPVPRWGKGVR